MRKIALSLMALSLGVIVTPAFADAIPYGNKGNVAPTTPVVATGTTLDVYFYDSSADDTDFILVKDVSQNWTSGMILDNHTATFGQEYVFPTGSNKIVAGDTLEFFLYNQTTNETYASMPGSGSADGYNHAYITPFSGEGVIPPGTFVGFEDLYIAANSDGHCTGDKNLSDCDYNDDEFVFVGVSPSATPEPSSLALLGTSILGAAGVIRRRFNRS